MIRVIPMISPDFYNNCPDLYIAPAFVLLYFCIKKIASKKLNNK